MLTDKMLTLTSGGAALLATWTQVLLRYATSTTALVFLGLIILGLCGKCCTTPRSGSLPPLTYSRDALLSLRIKDINVIPAVDFTVAVEEQLLPRNRLRKRGRRGGIRQRVRKRGTRPPLPSVIMGNVRSLRRKIEELRISARVCYEYREAGIIALTETWLHQGIPDSLFELDGFSLVRLDRMEATGKSRGGGIGVYIKDDWCAQHTVRTRYVTLIWSCFVYL